MTNIVMDLDNMTGREKWDLILKNQALIYNALDTIQVALEHSDESIAVKGRAKLTKPRFIYKESYETGKYIKVGILAEDDVIELYPPKDKTINTSIYQPTLYSTSWYVEPKGYEGTEQYLATFSSDINKTAPKQIVVKRYGTVDKVTGYLTPEGKAIYYDQYNW